MKQRLNSFQNKIVIVTGGASGIGRALCEVLGRSGAIVVIGDVDVTTARSVAEVLCSSGGRAEATFMDVTQHAVVQGVVEEVLTKYGVLDYMFNNAGTAIVGEMFDMNLVHWQRLIDINLWGVVHGTTVAYAIMRKQGHGHIVNIASMAGLLPGPTAVAYAMTKHAVVGLSESLRVEASDLGIRISVVCPSSIDTGINSRTLVLRGKTDDIFPGSFTIKPMLPQEAASTILQGVQRNQAIITLPLLSGKLLWWLYRISPSLVSKIAVYRIRRYRHLYQAN